MFYDLADPAKRTRDDIAAFLEIAMEFQKHFRVVLGLNYQESRQIGSVLGMPEPGQSPDGGGALRREESASDCNWKRW